MEVSPQNLKIKLLNHLAIPLPGIYPKENRYLEFIAALFIVAKLWK